MRASQHLRVLCVGFVVAATALSVAPAAGALAQQSGASGYSGKLSSNPALRKQQLICDPNDPTAGSTSALYDPSLVTFTDYGFGPGYQAANNGPGFVEVRDASNNLSLMPITMFLLGHGGLTETGYVQITYQRQGVTSSTGQLDPTRDPSNTGGYGVVAFNPGVTAGSSPAADTHALVFQLISATTPLTTVANYTLFADNGADTRNGGPRAGMGGFQSDFMSGLDPNTNQSFTLTPAQIAPVTVSGHFVPDPASAGLLALAAGGMLLRRGRGR